MRFFLYAFIYGTAFLQVYPGTLPAQVNTASRISVSFEKDTEIRDVIAAFAAFANKTIIAGPGAANTKIGYLEVRDQPWEIALSAVLHTVNLIVVEDTAGILTVDSYASLASRQAQEPLVSQLVPLNYAHASTLAGTLRAVLEAGCAKGILTPPVVTGMPLVGDDALPSASGPIPISTAGCGRGAVIANEKTNTLIISETHARLNVVLGFIRDLDVRTPLVAIKAKIIAVDRTGTEKLGISYDLGSARAFQQKLLPRSAGNTVIPGDFRVDLTGEAFAGIANASRTFKNDAAISLIYNMAIGGFNLTAFLDALSQVQLSDVQAEPSITTLDNTEAELFSGSTLSYLLTPPVPNGQLNAVTPQIQTKEIGIRLMVTPRVTANRQLNLAVVAEQEQLVNVTMAGPNTNKRSSKNEVLVADGETAVIGGLTQTSITKSRAGIPLLSAIPLLGRLFSETETIERKQDLIILITPHILDEGDVVRFRKIEKKP